MKITNELIESFLGFYRNEGKKEKTLYRYRYDFTAFHRWLKENKTDTIEAIDKLTIEQYKQHLFSLGGSKKSRYGLQEKLCSGTINQKLLAIKKFLEFTTYVFDIGLDPNKIRLNQVKYTRGDYFEVEEIKEILKAIDKTEKYRVNQLRFKLIILLCFVSGARLNEMRQITIQGIEEGKQYIHGKKDKDRWIFFNDQCKKLLKEYLKELGKPLPRLGLTLKSKSDLAIISHGYDTFGKEIGKQAINEMFKRLRNYLKRDKHLTLHTLRHSYATFMVNAGTNPFHLKELMGHEKLNTTAGYYHNNYTLLGKINENVMGKINMI